METGARGERRTQNRRPAGPREAGRPQGPLPAAGTFGARTKGPAAGIRPRSRAILGATRTGDTHTMLSLCLAALFHAPLPAVTPGSEAPGSEAPEWGGFRGPNGSATPGSVR